MTRHSREELDAAGFEALLRGPATDDQEDQGEEDEEERDEEAESVGTLAMGAYPTVLARAYHPHSRRRHAAWAEPASWRN